MLGADVSLAKALSLLLCKENYFARPLSEALPHDVPPWTLPDPLCRSRSGPQYPELSFPGSPLRIYQIGLGTPTQQGDVPIPRIK
ncbi:MAG: hypothetical protein AMXMBFR61_16450 [Fimbriimonadales bacterium]